MNISLSKPKKTFTSNKKGNAKNFALVGKKLSALIQSNSSLNIEELSYQKLSLKRRISENINFNFSSV